MNELPDELLYEVLGHLEVLDTFRLAMVCKRLRLASMLITGSKLADFTSLPVTLKNIFQLSALSAVNMRILRRYRAVDISRTAVTAHDVLRLLRCGLTDITIHHCFNIDIRSLLTQLREFGAEMPM
ncbi:hypothetical protein BGZ83_008987 [Gryganskiella cystojenkinii]|nr:hypothetical protein BGZ83_008987 [Gryganskiella cystojenkinii]